jgi:hypothetical protein
MGGCKMSNKPKPNQNNTVLVPSKIKPVKYPFLNYQQSAPVDQLIANFKNSKDGK